MEHLTTRKCSFCGKSASAKSGGNFPFAAAMLAALGGKPTGYAHLPCMLAAKLKAGAVE